MPRQLRVGYAGAVYHVMNRGDRRELIFQNDVDRQGFVETLGEPAQRRRGEGPDGDAFAAGDDYDVEMDCRAVAPGGSWTQVSNCLAATRNQWTRVKSKD
jgi:hypothetical protein